MNRKELIKKLSKLESINDQLVTEFQQLDQLLRQLGFSEGITTLKSAAWELMEEEGIDPFHGKPPIAG